MRTSLRAIVCWHLFIGALMALAVGIHYGFAPATFATVGGAVVDTTLRPVAWLSDQRESLVAVWSELAADKDRVAGALDPPR